MQLIAQSVAVHPSEGSGETATFSYAAGKFDDGERYKPNAYQRNWGFYLFSSPKKTGV
jgi:hypothetical protein